MAPLIILMKTWLDFIGCDRWFEVVREHPFGTNFNIRVKLLSITYHVTTWCLLCYWFAWWHIIRFALNWATEWRLTLIMGLHLSRNLLFVLLSEFCRQMMFLFPCSGKKQLGVLMKFSELFICKNSCYKLPSLVKLSVFIAIVILF